MEEDSGKNTYDPGAKGDTQAPADGMKGNEDDERERYIQERIAERRKEDNQLLEEMMEEWRDQDDLKNSMVVTDDFISPERLKELRDPWVIVNPDTGKKLHKKDIINDINNLLSLGTTDRSRGLEETNDTLASQAKAV